MVSVSVVIPCTDRTIGLKRAIESALNQQFDGSIDVVLVENNSRDRSLVKAVVSDIADNRVRHFYLDDCKNANVARNYGASLAQSEFIAFLDSDDEWLCGHVGLCLEKLSNEGVSAVYSGYILDNGFNRKEKCSRGIGPDETVYSFLFGGDKAVAQTSSYFLRSQVMGFCLWDEALKRNQDYDFFITVSQRFKWAYLDRVTTVVHWDEGSVRTYSLDSFRQFYEKHSINMADADKAFYLLEVLVALASYSKVGFDEFSDKIRPYRKYLGAYELLFTVNYTLAHVVLRVKSVVRKFFS